MTVDRLIDLYIERHNRAATCPSATGPQLERLRDGMIPSGGNPSAQEEARIFFAHLAYMFEKLLSPLERHILIALRTPIGQEPRTREVRDGELFVVESANQDGTVERGQQTRHGERFLRSARDTEGEPVEGWVVVEGMRAVYPTREQLAEAMGIPFTRIKYVIGRAYAKLRDSQQYAAVERDE